MDTMREWVPMVEYDQRDVYAPGCVILGHTWVRAAGMHWERYKTCHRCIAVPEPPR